LRRELPDIGAEMRRGRASGNVRSNALERGATSRGSARAERLPGKAIGRTDRAVVRNDVAGAEPRGGRWSGREYLAEAADRRRATDRREAVTAGR
jgi:hypothetical protein